tara:strand:- start:205 stop:654 length:450 start_codon:yes stop_codon:yes gene_type:complete
MFTWRYNISGGRYLSLSFYFKDTETFTKGDILTLDTGELDLGATNDTTFAGAFDGPFDPADAKKGSPGVVEGTDSTTLAKCIVNPDAVYGSADNNARNAGVNLDISGATGAMAIATDSNSDFLTVARKRQNADETLVMIAPGEHYLNPS